MKLKLILAICAAAFAVVGVTGCGGSDKPQAIGTEQQAKDMRAARKIFDENKGDWDKTPPEDQAKFEELVGKDKAKVVWAKMLNPYAPGPGAVKPQGGSATAKNPYSGN